MFRLIPSFLMILSTHAIFAQPDIHRHTNIHQHQRSPLTNALRTGTDTNGNILFLCQAKLFNSIQPGKTWAGYGRCNVPYGGKEYVVDQFTIPNQREFGHYNWERTIRGAMQIGRDTNGNPLFVCQSNFRGSIQPGKTWPGYKHCNISYAGREIITDNYRILSAEQEIIVHSPAQRRMHSHY